MWELSGGVGKSKKSLAKMKKPSFSNLISNWIGYQVQSSSCRLVLNKQARYKHHYMRDRNYSYAQFIFVDTEVMFVKSRDSPVSTTEESLGTRVDVCLFLPKTPGYWLSVPHVIIKSTALSVLRFKWVIENNTAITTSFLTRCF